MRKIKIITAALLCLGISSCGIFKKDCGCPHFYKAKNSTVTVVKQAA